VALNKFELLDKTIKDSEKEVDQLLKCKTFFEAESLVKGDGLRSILYFCDNIKAMLQLLDSGMEGKIDLVYIDPPFNTRSSYNKKLRLKSRSHSLDISSETYNDNWKNLGEYLQMMTIRLMLIHRLLSEKGTLYLHVDYRTAHYFRLILDHIFGEYRFLNEVIWAYKSGGTGRRSFSRKHDNILVYTKTDKYIFNPQKEKSYNRGFAPYRFKNVEEFKDEIGWHTLVNLRDVWNIDMVGRTSSERAGYETQKPLALLRRIIQTSSNEDSIVADFFLGSGTTAKAAMESGRKFIGSDSSTISYVTVSKRLKDDNLGSRIFADFNQITATPGKLTYRILKNGEGIVLYLQEYIPSRDELDSGKVDPEKLSSLVEESPLIFIDYIAVIGVNSERMILSEYFMPDIPQQIMIPDGYKNVIVQLVDVFGAVQEIAIGGDNIEQDGRTEA
jgi:DNA modification methylase